MDSLQDLKTDLEKSVRRHEERLATLSSKESLSVEERKAMKRVGSQLKKVSGQLQQVHFMNDIYLFFYLDDANEYNANMPDSSLHF